jgi:CRISPR-associated protein Csx17
MPVSLHGCRPEPLAGYLKALGVLRLVAEQRDPRAKGAWQDGVFVLHSTLSSDDLVAFLRDEYAPSPVITPWNGGSGFWDGDNQSGIAPIRDSTAARFAPYRNAIALAQDFVRSTGMEERPDSAKKAPFVQHLRSTLADDALPWIDAALVFTRDALVFPPLLGTGGNDGRLDFANNFMQRLAEELLVDKQTPGALRGALFGEPTLGLGDKAIGQFFPAAAGGANGGAGFSGSAGTNPWDYILLMEGAMCFATALVRRLESGDRSAMTFPFAVRSTTAGFGTAAAGEVDSRNELWLPLWGAPATWAEVSAVFREGRSRVGRRAAVTGTDFARALASLGVDRGIGSFTRYAFHLRNGLAYQAVPLGRWAVSGSPTPIAALLEDIDGWLIEVSRLTGKETPARLRTVARALDDAILSAVRPDAGPRDLQRLLGVIGEVEASAADSKDHGGLRHPVPELDHARWMALLDDGTAELDLAASIAPDLRRRWSAVRRFGARLGWTENKPPPSSRIWRRGPLVDRLLDLLQRERIEATREADAGADAFDRLAPRTARLASVCAFLEGRTDDIRIVELARALSLLSRPSPAHDRGPYVRAPAVFAAARMLVGGDFVGDAVIPPVIGWVAAARREDGATFTAMTWRRLTSSGVALRGMHRRTRASMLRGGDDVPVRRVAAACRFPLSHADRAGLLRAITNPSTLEAP